MNLQMVSECSSGMIFFGLKAPKKCKPVGYDWLAFSLKQLEMNCWLVWTIVIFDSPMGLSHVSGDIFSYVQVLKIHPPYFLHFLDFFSYFFNMPAGTDGLVIFFFFKLQRVERVI